VTDADGKKKEDKIQKKKKERQVGESHLVNKLGRFSMRRFQLVDRKTGKVFEPWQRKATEHWEWLRNDSALLMQAREEIATYGYIEKNAPIKINDYILPDIHANLAIFYSDKDGRPYDLAERLVPSNIKPGNRVRLTVLGCCSVIDVKPEKE
jgi:hypothetical protein